MGFQHALAMLGGIVSVPLIVGGPFDAKLSQAEKEYLVSAGLISSGILSFIQVCATDQFTAVGALPTARF